MKKLEFRFNNSPLIMIFYDDDLLDTSIMENKKTNILTTRVAQNRHDGIGWIFLIQVEKNALPKNILRIAWQLILFPTCDENFLKSIWTSYCTNVCKFKEFKDFFINIIDGNNFKFLLIDRLEKPTKFRLGWDNIFNAKELIENYIKSKEENNLIIPYNIKSNKRKRIQSYDADFDNLKNGNY